jgi:hypothetical protein
MLVTGCSGSSADEAADKKIPMGDPNGPGPKPTPVQGANGESPTTGGATQKVGTE